MSEYRAPIRDTLFMLNESAKLDEIGQIAESGWMALGSDPEWGGQG